MKKNEFENEEDMLQQVVKMNIFSFKNVLKKDCTHALRLFCALIRKLLAWW